MVQSGKLYKTITRNENWSSSSPLLNSTEEFKDIMDKVILKRTYVSKATGGNYNLYNFHPPCACIVADFGVDASLRRPMEGGLYNLKAFNC